MRQVNRVSYYTNYMSYIHDGERGGRDVTAKGLSSLSRAQHIAALLTALAAVAIGLVWWEHEELLLEWKRGLSPMAYYALLAVGGAIGLPTTPFYLAGGLLFGWAVALLGTAIAVLAMQILSYLIARGPMRAWSSSMVRAMDERITHGPLRSAAVRVLMVRLAPAVPSAVKSYVGASVGASFGVYLAVSFPVGFSYAAAMVMLGDSAATGNVAEGVAALAIVLALGLLAWRVSRTGRSGER